MTQRQSMIELRLNGALRRFPVEPGETLLHLLREQAHLTGAKRGCDLGECGACTVILDGRAVNSCCVFAEACDGASVETIEGIGTEDRPHPLQQAFVDCGAIQCGYCTPGMIMAAKALLDRNPRPTRQEIHAVMSGNLCRCTGYEKIQRAIETASDVICAYLAGEGGAEHAG
ncbi:MAG: (2Fe-2S)-binding protein [Oscillospiraceae bacterium]|nr:(2Fe-2S)-binding protein [Oscillospiraceae bacterium]